MKVKAIFKKPISNWYSTTLTIGDFIQEAEVELNLLHPTQEEVDDFLVMQKVVDDSIHTNVLVAIVDSMYILVDGHHTVAAYMIDGRQTIKARIFKQPIK